MAKVKTNSSLFADMLSIADARVEVESGPVYLNFAHFDELADLNVRLAKRGDASVRSVLLEYWSEASADGKRHYDEYQKLADTEKRTAEQDARYNVMAAQNNAINTAIDRAVRINQAVAWLKKQGCEVEIEKLRGVSAKAAYACYAKRTTERDRVHLNASQLYKLADDAVRAKLDAKADVVDMRSALKTQKAGTPNVNKAGGNGEAIAPSKLAEPVTNLDTTLAGLAKDGGGFAVGKEANAALLLLWARLDATLTDIQKQQGRDAFAAEGAQGKEAAKPATVPNVVTTVKKLVGAK